MRFIPCTETQWEIINMTGNQGNWHLEHQEVELSLIAAVVVVDGGRRVGHQHGDRVVPPHQLVHHVAHVEPVAVLAWKHQHTAAEGRGAGLQQQQQQEHGQGGSRLQDCHRDSEKTWLSGCLAVTGGNGKQKKGEGGGKRGVE